MTQKIDINIAANLIKEDTNPAYMYTKKELKMFYEWFMENREEHLKMFEEKVNEMAGHKVWENTYTPESLIRLAEILYPLINGVTISEEEYQERLNNANPIVRKYIYNFDLTHEEKIFTFLGSIYLGEVIIKSYPQYNLHWELCTLPKNYIFSGHMVINIVKYLDSCPILIFYPFIHGCLRHRFRNEPQDNKYLYTYFSKVTRALRTDEQKKD